MSEEFLRLLSMENKLLLETGSTPVVGSSKNSRAGHPISDMAQQSFLLFPPLKFMALVLEKEFKSSVSFIKCFWNSISSLGIPLTYAI